MAIEVTRMTEADIDGAIDTIQQAFKDDPYHRWVFDESKFSPTRNRTSLRIRCRWGLTHGLFYVAKDPTSSTPSKVLGTAMWLPPKPTNAPESWSEYLASWQLWANQVYMNTLYGRGGLRVNRYYIWKSSQASCQSEIWTDPRGYYFCNIVTVLPEAQGRGIGRILMKAVLDEADEKNMRCYLESSRDVPNVGIYEKMGFRVVKKMECRDGEEAIDLFCMVREPKAGKLGGKGPEEEVGGEVALAEG